MNWLLARFQDRTTRIGLPLIMALAVVGWAIARFGYGIHFLPQHALAPLGALLTTLLTPDSAASKIARPVIKAWLTTFVSLNPNTPAVSIPRAPEGSMSVFDTIEQQIAAAEAEAERIAAQALAAAKSQAGRAIIDAAIAELPAEDQPIANIVKDYGLGTITLPQALQQLYAIHEQAKAALPPGAVIIPVAPAPEVTEQ